MWRPPHSEELPSGVEANRKVARGAPPRINIVTTSPPLADFTDEQLEEMLSKRRLEQLNMPEEGRLSSDQQEQLEELIVDFADVFSLTDSDLGHTNIVQHTIDSDDQQHTRRMPFIRRSEVVELIDDMTDKGILQPSTSAWASPIILVS